MFNYNIKYELFVNIKRNIFMRNQFVKLNFNY